MTGISLSPLMRLGGWTTLRIVQHHMAVSAEHIGDAVA